MRITIISTAMLACFILGGVSTFYYMINFGYFDTAFSEGIINEAAAGADVRAYEISNSKSPEEAVEIILKSVCSTSKAALNYVNSHDLIIADEESIRSSALYAQTFCNKN